MPADSLRSVRRGVRCLHVSVCVHECGCMWREFEWPHNLRALNKNLTTFICFFRLINQHGYTLYETSNKWDFCQSALILFTKLQFKKSLQSCLLTLFKQRYVINTLLRRFLQRGVWKTSSALQSHICTTESDGAHREQCLHPRKSLWHDVTVKRQKDEGCWYSLVVEVACPMRQAQVWIQPVGPFPRHSPPIVLRSFYHNHKVKDSFPTTTNTFLCILTNFWPI